MRNLLGKIATFVLAFTLCGQPALAAQGPLLTNAWSPAYCHPTASSGAWSCTFALPNQAAGNLLIAAISAYDATTNDPISFNTPAGWTALDSKACASSALGQSFYSVTSTAVTSLTFTGTSTGASDALWVTLLVAEFANYAASPIDQHGIGNCGGSTGAIAGVSETPSQTNDTVIGVLFCEYSISGGGGTFFASTQYNSVAGLASSTTLNLGSQMNLGSQIDQNYFSIFPNYAGSSAQAPPFYLYNASATLGGGCAPATILLNPGTLGSYAGGGGTTILYGMSGSVGYSDPIFEKMLALV